MLDFTEALKDSPAFRHDIILNERHFDRVQKKLEDTLRFVDVVVEHGQNYAASFYNLTASLNGLWSDMNVEDGTANETYKMMSDALSQIVNLNKSLIELSYPNLRVTLENFLKKDLGKLNETRNHFESLSNSMAEALAKKASINKTKIHELHDAKNSLTAVGTCFAHNSLDYVAQLNIAHAKKCHIVLESLWVFVNEYSSFFRKGYLFFVEKPEICLEDVTESIELLKGRIKIVERKMQDRHSIVPKEVFQHPAGLPIDPHVVMEGYLFKRATNAFKTWNRRWFMIKEDKLVGCCNLNNPKDNPPKTPSPFFRKKNPSGKLYLHKSAEAETPTVMEENLKLCLVRPAPPSVERACCFELVTPSKNHLLQADSETLCQAWIRALQRTIQHLHENDQSVKRPSRQSFINNFETATTSTTCGAEAQNPMDIKSNRKLESQQRDFVSSNLSHKTMPSNAKLSENEFSSALQNHTTAGFRNAKNRGGGMGSSTFTNSTETMHVFREKLLQIPGNEKCADCGCRDAKWASINLGIVICIECSGAHRSLGVHRSKVRSLTMDSLDPEQKNILLQLGNKKVNSIYLAFLHENENSSGAAAAEDNIPTENSTRDNRETWVKIKYVEKKYAISETQRSINNSLKSHARSTSMNDMASYGITHYNSYFSPTSSAATNKSIEENNKNSENLEEATKTTIENNLSTPAIPLANDNRISRTSFGSDSNIGPLDDRMILSALESGCLEAVLRLMVRGFDLNAKIGSTYALHVAVNFHRTTLIEFLLLNDARINNLDEDLNTALHVAASSGHTIEVYQLLKRNMDDQTLKNKNGQTPLDMAVESRHADIVTLLRLHEMRDEFNDNMDSTMNDVDNFIDDLAAKQKLNERDTSNV